MSEKSFKIVNGDMSDGHHTFDELYEHRCLLFLTWLVEIRELGAVRQVFFLKDHFPGWDLVSTTVGIAPISYHVPAKYREVLEKHFKEYCDLEKFYDGHTSADVLHRLELHLRSYLL